MTQRRRPAPLVLPQQMMAAGCVVPLEPTEALAKEQEDNKRLRAELHDVQAELHHVHLTGNRLEAERAKFEKLSLDGGTSFRSSRRSTYDFVLKLRRSKARSSCSKAPFPASHKRLTDRQRSYTNKKR
jgi:hypothetical protein